MKIRNGFVSNSSSSSFIIQLKKPIEKYTCEEFLTKYGLSESRRLGTELYQELSCTEIRDWDVDALVRLTCDKVPFSTLTSLEEELEEYAKKRLLELAQKKRNENIYAITCDNCSDLYDFVGHFSGTIERNDN